MPASALTGCDVAGIHALGDDVRASDLIKADVTVIHALADCRNNYLSLVNHINIACQK